MKYKKVLLAITLLSFSLQTIPSPSYAAEEYKTLEEFLDGYDSTVEYETGSRLLPKEGDDVERFLDLIFEHLPDLTEEQMAQVIEECGRDIGCWEAMASEYDFQNEEGEGGKVKRNAFRMVWGWIKSGGKFAGDFVSDVWGTFREKGVQGLVERVTGFFGRLGERIKGFVGSVGDGVKSRSRRVWEGTKGFFGGIKRGVGGFFDGVRDKINRLFGEKKEEKNEREEKIKEIEGKYSVDIEDGTAKWDTEELDWMGEVFGTLPSEFYEKDNLSKIERVEGTSKCGSYNTESHDLKVYDAYDTSDKKSCIDDGAGLSEDQRNDEALGFKITLAHELTHIYANSNKGLVDEFAEFSWKKKEIEITIFVNGEKQGTIKREEWVIKDSPENWISDYAEKIYPDIEDAGYKEEYSEAIGLPNEDLAESVAYFVFAPTLLRNVSEAKYNFIKDKVFNGKEYTND